MKGFEISSPTKLVRIGNRAKPFTMHCSLLHPFIVRYVGVVIDIRKEKNIFEYSFLHISNEKSDFCESLWVININESSLCIVIDYTFGKYVLSELYILYKYSRTEKFASSTDFAQGIHWKVV